MISIRHLLHNRRGITAHLIRADLRAQVVEPTIGGVTDRCLWPLGYPGFDRVSGVVWPRLPRISDSVARTGTLLRLCSDERGAQVHAAILPYPGIELNCAACTRHNLLYGSYLRMTNRDGCSPPIVTKCSSRIAIPLAAHSAGVGRSPRIPE